MIRRIPLRARLTLAFGAVMAVLLTAAGFFLSVSLSRGLDSAIDRSLRARASDVQALVKQADEGLAQAGRSPLTEQGENFAQILTPAGVVVDSTPGIRNTNLLTPEQLGRARTRSVTVPRRAVAGEHDAFRLLAAPVDAQGRRLIVLVGAALDERDDALRQLTTLLLIAGPIGLLLASGLGYWIASAALRPVEAMRRQADRISGGKPGERLPVPPADDEIRRLGETLNRMLTRIDSVLVRERVFVSDASHELRTPLAILKGELELALRPGRTPDELRTAIMSAGEEADRLARLAEDLLVIARLDQGRLPVRRTPVDLPELLSWGAGRFGKRAADAGRRVEVTPVEAGLTVQADRLRLEQALGNLIDNALRHGGGDVVLGAQRRDGHVEIHVRDHGAGVPEEFLQTAFERFTRTDAARGRGGSGLGLSIVEAIARAHGGHAEVTLPGDGLDVALVLPMTPPHADGHASTDQPRRG